MGCCSTRQWLRRLADLPECLSRLSTSCRPVPCLQCTLRWPTPPAATQRPRWRRRCGTRLRKCAHCWAWCEAACIHLLQCLQCATAAGLIWASKPEGQQEQSKRGKRHTKQKQFERRRQSAAGLDGVSEEPGCHNRVCSDARHQGSTRMSTWMVNTKLSKWPRLLALTSPKDTKFWMLFLGLSGPKVWA